MTANLTRRAYLRYLGLAALALPVSGCRIIGKAVAHNHPKIKGGFDSPTTEKTIIGSGSVDYVGDETHCIPVLHLRDCNPFSRGYHRGALLGREVKENIDNVYRGGVQLIAELSKPRKNRKRKHKWAARALKLLSKGDKHSIINSLLDRAWEMLQPYTSLSELAEMEGLVCGLKDAGIKGVSLRTIHRMYAIPDFSETSCSALVAGGSATRDGHTWQLRILDYLSVLLLEKTPLITVYHPSNERELAFANVGWAGFIGVVTGVNEKGVCISEMGFGNHGFETLSGTPMPDLIKTALRYAQTTEEAVIIFQTARRTNNYVYLVGDPQASMAGLITSMHEFKKFRVNEHDIVEHGKHRLPQFKDVIYAGHNNDEQCELVSRMHGTLNLETIQEMARGIAMKSNIQSVIFDLTRGDLWVAQSEGDRRAADSAYVKFPREAWKL